MNKALENWNEATEELAEEFMDKYFPESDYAEDSFWVSDEIGDVFVVGSDLHYCFDVKTMRQAIELDVSSEVFFEYHEYGIDYGMKNDNTPTPINFRNFVKLNDEERKKQCLVLKIKFVAEQGEQLGAQKAYVERGN